jgi:hypothetical protein
MERSYTLAAADRVPQPATASSAGSSAPGSASRARSSARGPAGARPSCPATSSCSARPADAASSTPPERAPTPAPAALPITDSLSSPAPEQASSHTRIYSPRATSISPLVIPSSAGHFLARSHHAARSAKYMYLYPLMCILSNMQHSSVDALLVCTGPHPVYEPESTCRESQCPFDCVSQASGQPPSLIAASRPLSVHSFTGSGSSWYFMRSPSTASAYGMSSTSPVQGHEML